MTMKAETFPPTVPEAQASEARARTPKSGEHPAVRAYHTTLVNCGAVAAFASRRLAAHINAAADKLESEPPPGGAIP